MTDAILTEDAVVEATCACLKNAGWRIVQQLTSRDRGVDVIATNDGRRLLIEAKGQGSAREGSARFGLAFSSGQVFDHVAKAVLVALRAVSDGDLAAVALPDDRLHRGEINRVRRALDAVAVGVFWAPAQGPATFEGSWTL
jgi:Holliday junction resolvase-like predicted endonuclease